jgi:hypothetical protein
MLRDRCGQWEVPSRLLKDDVQSLERYEQQVVPDIC